MAGRDPLPTKAEASERSGATEKATSVELPRAVRAPIEQPKLGEGTGSWLSDAWLTEESVARASLLEEPPVVRELGTFEQLVGATLGSFTLIKPLAAGGMGAVFLARKEAALGVKQHAALKLIHAQLSGERDFIDMFLDEARIASFLQHPNICRVLDFGLAHGTYFLAMEYVHGETWAELYARLSSQPLAAQSVPLLTAFVLAQTCEGLHAAHTALGDDGEPLQIVHRDVSPQNIFVAYDGTVRVIDFGVARARDRITSTRAGVVKGKIAYMAPEQVMGGHVDARADVWALGVVLRESLEGYRLFRRSNDTETVRALMVEPIPRWCAEVEPELRAIADKALARDPDERYQSAREMGAALSAYLLRQAAPLGTPELSIWMHQLFPEELAQKRALLQYEDTPPRPEARALGYADTVTDAVTARPKQRIKIRAQPATQRARFDNAWLIALLVVGAGALVYLLSLARDEAAARAVSMLVAPEGGDELSARPMSDSKPLSLGPKHVQALPEPEAEPEPQLEERTRTQSGTLLIAFNGGWAEVHERGKLLGTTPGRYRMSPGPHTLLIKPFGRGAGFTRNVTISAGRTDKLLLGQ